MDHGIWTPLFVMFPDASIPVCSLSVRRDIDALAHIQVSLSALRERVREQQHTLRANFESLAVYNNYVYDGTLATCLIVYPSGTVVVQSLHSRQTYRQTYPEHSH